MAHLKTRRCTCTILDTGWTVRASNPGGGARFSAPVQTDPGAHPASCTMGTGSFPGVKSGRGVTLTPHPLLVPWSRMSRAIPLLPSWVVRPVHSLSACTVQGCTLSLHITVQYRQKAAASNSSDSVSNILTAYDMQ